MTFLFKMNELALLKTNPIVSADKEGLSSMVSSYIQELAFNGGEPLNDLAICRKYIYVLEELEKGLKDYAISELNSFDKQEAEILGASLKVIETGVKNDYSATPSWLSQKEVVDLETRKLKEIEAMAKSLKGKLVVVDEETGETKEFYPPVKTSSTSIRVTIK